MKTKADVIAKLKQLGACENAQAFVAASKKKTAKAIWNEIPRGDWLLWVAGRVGVDLKLLVLAACKCARTALKYAPKGDERPRIAIETAERWTRGKATIEEVGNASNAAHAAAHAAYAAADAAYAAADAAAHAAAHAAYAAAHAAYAAADAAYAAADAAADAAAYAADAADAAAYAAAAYAAAHAAADAYAAADAAKEKGRQATANLVRQTISWDDLKEALS